MKFVEVNDTYDFRLTHLKDSLINLGLDIDDIRGQSRYKMKGKHKGIQRRLLDINPRAFYTPLVVIVLIWYYVI